MSLPVDLTALHKLRIMALWNNKQVSAVERKKSVWSYVLMAETASGTQWIKTIPDSRLYVVLGASKEILGLHPHKRGSDQMFAYLFEMYGVDRMDPITTVIYEQMRTHTLNHGLSAELRRFAAYNKSTQASYISTYSGQMWKIDGSDQPEKIDTGEDGIFFIDDDHGIPIEPEYGANGVLLEKLTSLNFENGPGGITADVQRRFMTVWMFAQAFPDLLPDKPIILLEGLKGSGKTTAVLLIQLALTGRHKLLSISKDQEKEFGVLLLRSPICVFDNMDTYIDWLPDQIARYCTGGSFAKRKLFTDDDEVEIHPKSFIAITSRNPSSFRRDDVVDRLMIVRLKRYDGDFLREEKLISDIENNRAALLGEWMWYVDKIVAAIKNGAIDDAKTEKWRMASFAAFTRVVGRVLEWSNDEIEEMLDTMQIERDLFEGEGDALLEVLQDWINYRPKNLPSPVGHEYTLYELFKILSNSALGKGITFYKHHKTLLDKLTSSYVARHFRVVVRTDEKTGTKYIRIWRVTDPVLDSVSQGETEMRLEPEPEPKPTKYKIRVIK